MLKEYMKKFIGVIVLFIVSIPVFAGNNEFGVLCYHNVVDESVKYEKQQYFPQTISAEVLISHFDWLKNNGYTPVSWQQILDARNGKGTLPDKAVLLTFDDGYESFYNVIYPLLKAYNYPAVYAIVTDWINTPANKKINYGNQKLDRDAFLTWQQLREIQASGLVEIASHSNNLHHGIAANPAGSSLPAIIAVEYKNGKYETHDKYRSRLRKDFQRSYDLLKTNLGVAPRVMVWPYGQFTDEAAHLAEQVGFDTHMSLVETKINTPEQSHVGRLLLDTETSIETIADYLAHKNTTPDVQRSIRVKLDSVYDPNPVKQKKNLDELVERIHRYGITKVYLQAFSDMNNDGVAEALYFNNKYLPIRADIFGQIAWILDTRLDVEVYAWMPIFAFDVKEGNSNLRLSPNEARSIEIIKSIYADLSFYNKFDGILFHHDAFLSQVEEKTQDLFNITDQLKEVVYPYSLKGRKKFKTARSLTIRPESEAQFVQDLEAFTKHYSTVLVQAMPYMEDKQVSVREARNWLNALVKKTLSSVPSDKVLFELQTVNWRTQKAIADDELIDWMKDLQDNKVYSFGYYPDNFLLDQPSMKKLRPYFSVNRNIGLQ